MWKVLYVVGVKQEKRIKKGNGNLITNTPQ